MKSKNKHEGHKWWNQKIIWSTQINDEIKRQIWSAQRNDEIKK